MSVATATPPIALHAPPRRWSVEEFEAMIAAGAVTREMRVELIEGIITEKTGTGSVHDFIVRQLARLLISRLGDDHAIGVQSPTVIAPDSRPEPDLWVSQKPNEAHRDQTATAADLYLVVEVADSSLPRDRTVKLPLYARAGVLQLWIVNVATEEIERYGGPRPDGSYATKEVFARGDRLTDQLIGAVDVAAVVG